MGGEIITTSIISFVLILLGLVLGFILLKFQGE
uniref:Cytochrome b6-f complex subunit 7 n=1 Tax=Gracilariopsis longissima TaxID=172976 RepID=A0A345U9L9_9FLOR|nr:cytochrome b6-f complex subunit 7 [Gracilariopsis longissima]AXI97155.1 cytochrome b6-f complex subunit 7 [Gracilariopsis longissima]UAD89071.1 cytochrome b6-f complex subunit 7 [Gracilariopsis longissima]